MKDRDSGSSLIEAVIGLSLLGIVLVGVVDAAWTNARVAAETHRRAVDAAAFSELGHIVQATEHSTCPHIDLSYLDRLEQTTLSKDEHLDIAITRYEYWNDTSSTWVDFGHLPFEECSSLEHLTNPFAVQRLSLSISRVRGPSSMITVVKSRDLPI